MTDSNIMEYAPTGYSFSPVELTGLAGRPYIIGITGKKNSGKTTLSNAIAAQLTAEGLMVDQGNMSDPLHEMLMRYNPWVKVGGYEGDYVNTVPRRFYEYRYLTNVYGYERAKELFVDYRRQQRDLGTEGVREADPWFWVYQNIKRIYQSRADVYIISAIRFPNELDSMPDLLIETINDQSPDDDTHASETNIAATLSRAAELGILTFAFNRLDESVWLSYAVNTVATHTLTAPGGF